MPCVQRVALGSALEAFATLIGVLAVLAAAGPLACTAATEPAVGREARLAAGEHTYRTKCASCHGRRATGDGDRAGGLSPRPTDLTRLTERSGGRFRADDVAAHIDGRVEVASHGERSMPVWGETGILSDADVRDVVTYLETLQRR
jgi:mono/diheme cytochrome c family protein